MLNLVFSTTVTLLLVSLPFGTTAPTSNDCEQPYYKYNDNVPGVYLVDFTDGYTLDQHFDTLGQRFNVTKLDTGYFSNLTTDLLGKVRTDCGVQFLEDDVSGLTPAEDDNDIGDGSSVSLRLARRGRQKEAPWPLYKLSASQKDPTEETYYYVDNPGQGVDVYILDSGIDHPQDEFNDDDGNDRVVDDANFSTDPSYRDNAPNAGHGTRVASAIGGNRYGVAKSATLHNVKFERYGKPDAGSAGNFGFSPNHYPSSHPDVISVGASNNDYTPWSGIAESSNYGEDEIDLWAPGKNVPLCNKAGREDLATGTSFASGYVTGILAIFYGVEGTDMNPDLAKTRLMAQTDNWIDLPADFDWRNNPTAFANTGNRKGAGKSPPVPYIGGPELAAASAASTAATAAATASPSLTPTHGCQSPNHDSPLTSFTLDQGNYALAEFISECQGVELTPDGPIACTLYYNPCSQNDGAKAVDVVMTVWQSVWSSDATSTWPDSQEMQDAVVGIMNSCDTTTTTSKWGGYKSVNVASGMRMYNVSANQDGQYPTPIGFHTVKDTTKFKGEHCQAWDSA